MFKTKGHYRWEIKVIGKNDQPTKRPWNGMSLFCKGVSVSGAKGFRWFSRCRTAGSPVILKGRSNIGGFRYIRLGGGFKYFSCSARSMGKFCEGNLISLSRFPLSESCLDSCHCFLLRKRVTQKNKSSLPHPARPKGDGSVATCRDATVPFWLGNPFGHRQRGRFVEETKKKGKRRCRLMTVVYDIYIYIYTLGTQNHEKWRF